MEVGDQDVTSDNARLDTARLKKNPGPMPDWSEIQIVPDWPCQIGARLLSLGQYMENRLETLLFGGILFETNHAGVCGYMRVCAGWPLQATQQTHKTCSPWAVPLPSPFPPHPQPFRPPFKEETI